MASSRSMIAVARSTTVGTPRRSRTSPKKPRTTRRRATSEGANANYDGTVATYRQTTLIAFQEVEDNLAALRILEKEAEQQRDATASAKESLQLFTNRYEGGVDNYLQVITAQTTALANERNDIDIQRRRMDASVQLVKAVGGGWDTSQLPKY